MSEHVKNYGDYREMYAWYRGMKWVKEYIGVYGFEGPPNRRINIVYCPIPLLIPKNPLIYLSISTNQPIFILKFILIPPDLPISLLILFNFVEL